MSGLVFFPNSKVHHLNCCFSNHIDIILNIIPFKYLDTKHSSFQVSLQQELRIKYLSLYHDPHPCLFTNNHTNLIKPIFEL